jgi:hypothetical protein
MRSQNFLDARNGAEKVENYYCRGEWQINKRQARHGEPFSRQFASLIVLRMLFEGEKAKPQKHRRQHIA